MGGTDGDGGAIGRYAPAAAACHPYDRRFPEVARRVGALIRARMPDARVEHVGSTAVPGCAGKGVVDLLLLYPPGRLAAARGALDALGFQRQGGRDPWPEERPMRIGSVAHAGAVYRLHVHVVAADSTDAARDLHFRDLLRGDPGLVAAYVAAKRAVLAAGTTDPEDYAVAKGAFVEGVLRRAERDVPGEGDRG